ncbi:MAG: hypothetical protein DRO36_04395 [Candidatus Hecatellales archaeon]|nr:MAG: hypothetical protein DRO36_04395 [Candidatus Hecatellales archaeon]
MTLRGHYVRKPVDILDRDQLDRIHQGILEVLEEVGVIFDLENACKILEGMGCDVDYKSKQVKFPSYLVEEILRKAQPSFTVKARNHKYDLRVGGNYLYFHGWCTLATLDLETRRQKTPTRQEYIEACRVLDALDEVHGVLPPYGSIDTKPEEGRKGVIMNEILIRNVQKVCWTTHGSTTNMKAIIEMAKATDQQIILTLSGAPPLRYGENAIKGILEFAKADFPLCTLHGIIYGANSPTTLAGSLVLDNALIIAGMALAQAINPKVGFIPCTYAMAMDMRTGQLVQGSVERGIYSMAFTQMWRRYYNLPSATIVGSDAKYPDYQCGWEKALNTVVQALAGPNFILVHGGIYDELLWSPVVAVIDNEMLKFVARLLEGMRIDDETLAIDLIKEVGPVGQFLNKKHTKEWWRREHVLPNVSDRSSYAEWVENGAKDIIERAKAKTREILEKHEVLPLTEEQEKKISEIVRKYHQIKSSTQL